MSGPKTSSYRFERRGEAIAAALLAARRQQESEQEARAREEVLRAEAERRRKQVEEEARQREVERRQVLSLTRQEQRQLFEWRRQLAARLAQAGTPAPVVEIPVIPEVLDGNVDVLRQQREGLVQLRDRLEQLERLVGGSEALRSLHLDRVSQGQSVADMLTAWKGRQNAQQRENVAEEASRTEIRRRSAYLDSTLACVKTSSLDELPLALEYLLQQALDASTPAQFDMLMLEVQLQAARYNAVISEREKERAEAQRINLALIEAKADEIHQGVMSELREVCDGLRDLSGDLKSRANTALAEAQLFRQKELDAMAGVALAQSLADLGYEVEGVAETVFAEGGSLYFQAHDWGDRYVRVKTLPKRGQLHFNLVRSAESMANAAMDQEIETAWCTNYDNLRSKMAMRGLATTPLRAMEVGVFEAESVPELSQIQTRRRQARGMGSASKLMSKP